MSKKGNTRRILSLLLIFALMSSLLVNTNGVNNYAHAAGPYPGYWPADPASVIPVTAGGSPVDYTFTAGETKWFSVVPAGDYFYIRVRIKDTNFGGLAANYPGQFNFEIVDPFTGLTKNLDGITIYDSTNNGSGYIMYTSTLFPDDLGHIERFGHTSGTISYFAKVTATQDVDVDISYSNVDSAGSSITYPTGPNNGLYLTIRTDPFRYINRLLMTSDFNGATYTYNGAASPVKLGDGSTWNNASLQRLYAYLEFGAENSKTTAFRAKINGQPADGVPSGNGIDLRSFEYDSASGYKDAAKGWIKYNGGSVNQPYFTFNCGQINWGAPNTVVIDAVPQNLQSWKTYTFNIDAPAGSSDTSFSWIKAGTSASSASNNEATLVSGDDYKITLTPGTAGGADIYFAVDPAVCYHNGAVLSNGGDYSYTLTEYGSEWNNSYQTPTPFAAPEPGASEVLTLTVTAQDNVTTKEYTITVENPVPSSNNNIAALSIQPKDAGTYTDLTASDTTFSHTFDSEETTFDLKIDTEDSVKSVTCAINGGAPSNLTANESKNQFTKTAVPAAAGDGEISIIVTAEDDSTKTYTFNISRPASNVAALADIALGNSYQASIPGFDTNTKNYDVPINSNSPYILAKLSNSAATIISITNISSISQPWGNGYYGNTLNLSGLAEGDTMSVQIQVQAEDGIATDTYAINITKDTTAPTVVSVDYPEHQGVVPISFDKIKFTFDETAAPYTSGPFGRIMYFDRVTVQEANSEYISSRVNIDGSSVIWTHSSTFTSSKYPGTKYFLRLNSSVGYQDIAGNRTSGYQTSTDKATVSASYHYFTVGHLDTLSVNGTNIDFDESTGKFTCDLPEDTTSATIVAVTQNSNSNSDIPSETVTGVSVGETAAQASGNTYTSDISSLTAGTNSFDVVVATSEGTETYPLEISIESSVPADTTSPVWETGYPKTDPASVTSTSLKVLLKADESGTYYYLVLPYNSIAPGVAEVKAGNAPAGVTRVASGSGSITAPDEAEITLTGLEPDTTYDIYILAEDDEETPNEQSSLAKVEAATSALPHSGGSGSNTGSSAPNDINITVNGKTQAGLATKETVTENGQVKEVVTITDTIRAAVIDQKPEGSTITIPVATGQSVSGQVSGKVIKEMEEKAMILEIKTDNASYKVPADSIKISNLQKVLGAVDTDKIKITVDISVLPDDRVQKIEQSIQGPDREMLTHPIDFNITAAYEDETVEVDRFDRYVEREVAIPDAVIESLIEKIRTNNADKVLDVNLIIEALEKITTAVMQQRDDTSTHIPTEIMYRDGNYVAKINSLTNSIYYLIYNEEYFADIGQHWAAESIQNMANRTVVRGIGNNQFEPDREVTRGEFALMLVTGLGLHRALEGEDVFLDVTKDKYYYDAIFKGHQYNLIKGISASEFAPDKKISREELAAMVIRALDMTGTNGIMSDEEADVLLSQYADSGSISNWARNSMASGIKLGIINGDKDSIMPQRSATRAECIVIIERLLKTSELINRENVKEI